MPATHYTQWIFNKIKGTDFAKGKKFELRLTFGTDEYDYGVSHPTDCIFLDQLKIVDFGKTKWQRYDESCSLVAANRTIEFRDQYSFSGTVNGSPTGEIDLIADKTSLLPFLFQSTGQTCFMHLSQLNPDGSLKEIYFSGILDTELIDGNVIQLVNPMGSNERKIQTKKYLFITAGGELQKHTVEELVSGSRTNGVPDGRIAGLTQSDMYSFPGKTRGLAAWWMGLIVKSGVDWNTIWQTDDTIGTSGVFYNASNKVYQPCFYPSSADSTFIGFKNPYGVQDGFQALTYSTLLSKIGDICRFIYSSTAVDNDFTQFVQHYDGLRFNTDSYGVKQAATLIMDDLVINYNVRLGVKPTYFMISDGSSDSINADNSLFSLPRYTITAATNATPIVCTLAKSINMPVGATYQACRITGALGNTNANNAVTFTVIDSTHVSLQDVSGVDISGNGAYTANSGIMQLGDEDWFSLTTPATWSRSDTLADIMKRICYRFGLLMDFEISQSGPNKGRPEILLRDILKPGNSIPTAWTAPGNPTLLKGTIITERQQTIKNVRLKYVGDTSEVYCPTDKGESFDIEIHGRTKQWGGNAVYDAAFFINNGNGNVNLQQDTTFNFDADTFAFGNSWVIGACDFVPLTAPAGYNSNFTSTDYDEPDFKGYYPITYEEFFGTDTKNWDARLPSADTIYDGVANTSESHFNTVVNKAKYFANVFLNSLTIEKRSFRTSVDDSGNIRTLRPNLTGSWLDENGTVTSKLLHTIEIDELRGISDCEFVPALPDYRSLTDYTVIVKNGNGAGTGGVVGGAGGGPAGSGGTTDISLAIIKAPNSPTRNTITGDTAGDSALTIIGSEDLPPYAVTVANGQNDDVSILDASGISRSSLVLTGPTAVFSVTGWTHGINGRLLYVRNGTAFDCTLKDNFGSASNDQIRTPGHADFVIPQDGGCMFRYETSDNKWHVLEAGAEDFDFPVTTTTISAASTNNVAILTSPTNQTQAAFINNTHGAAITITGIVAPSQNCMLLLMNPGSFELTLALNSGSSSVGNKINYTNYANVLGVIPAGGAALLLYDTVNTRWQIVNIFPLPAEQFDATYFTVTQASDGAPIITLNATWLATLLTTSSGAFLKDSPANQTVQSSTLADYKTIWKQKSGDTNGAIVFDFQNASAASKLTIANDGTIDTSGNIRYESGHEEFNIRPVDINGFLAGLNILDLDPLGSGVIVLTDTSGNMGVIYSLCGIVAGAAGQKLVIILDPIFVTNGNQIQSVPNSVAELTAANRIADLPTRFFQSMSFIYNTQNSVNRWKPIAYVQ